MMALTIQIMTGMKKRNSGVGIANLVLVTAPACWICGCEVVVHENDRDGRRGPE